MDQDEDRAIPMGPKMAKTGPKWPKMVPKMPKNAQNGPNDMLGQYMPFWAIPDILGHFYSFLPIFKNGQNWTVFKNGPNFVKMTPYIRITFGHPKLIF